MSARPETSPPRRRAARPAPAGPAVTLSRLTPALIRWLVYYPFLLVGPLLVIGIVMYEPGNLLYDFQGGLWNAGVAILHGHSPYWPHFLEHQAAIMRSGRIALGETTRRPFSVPVYPAAANVAVIPLSLLPLWLAGSIYTVGEIAAMVGGIWLLGVRDWRCFALALISWPFTYGLYLGTVGPFLVLGAGVAWRYRDRLWPPALAVASLIALKIFPWTLAAWLLATKRYRALAYAIGVCALMTIGAWATIGFHGLLQYPQMLSNMSFLQEGRATSLVTLMVFCGVPPNIASALAILCALGILGVAIRLAKRPGGDRRAFGLAIIAALAGTPIVWEHYMVLLFVPIALMSPRASWLWLAPVVGPVIELLSRLVVPDSGKLQAYSPNALRGLVIWGVVQGIVVFQLCTTAEQRSALKARIPRLRSRPARRVERPVVPVATS